MQCMHSSIVKLLLKASVCSVLGGCVHPSQLGQPQTVA